MSTSTREVDDRSWERELSVPGTKPLGAAFLTEELRILFARSFLLCGTCAGVE